MHTSSNHNPRNHRSATHKITQSEIVSQVGSQTTRFHDRDKSQVSGGEGGDQAGVRAGAGQGAEPGGSPRRASIWAGLMMPGPGIEVMMAAGSAWWSRAAIFCSSSPISVVIASARPNLGLPASA